MLPNVADGWRKNRRGAQMTGPATPSKDQISKLNIDIPHGARIWNYVLCGKAKFASDRETGEPILAIVPDMVTSARADREFLIRAAEYLAGQAGVRQFLDIGTGLPTANNTHQVAQRVAPESRIVYV